MDQKTLFDFFKGKLEQWERKTELNQQSVNENLKKLFEINSSKDQFLKEVVQGFQEIMKQQPDAQQKMFDRSMETIDREIENTRKMAEKAQLWQKKYELQRQAYERILRDERKQYDRAIDVLVKKISRLQGKGDLGSSLMRMVSEREDEIKRKYASVPMNPEMSNAVSLVSNNSSLPLLN